MISFSGKKALRKETGSAEIIADLDSIIEKELSFKLHGKIHKINKLSTENFFVIANEFAKIEKLIQGKDKVTKEEFIETYYELFSKACDSLTKKDIEKMSLWQCAQLFQFITDIITGRIFSDEKKKNLVPLMESQEEKKDIQPPA